MRHLYVMRHAKAKQGSGDLDDHQRPLNKRGQKQAAAMAMPLRRWQALEGEVHVSSATRTLDTLDAIALQFPKLSLTDQAFVDETLYTLDGQVLLAWLRALPDETERVLVIGHNPALLELAHWLCTEAPASLPTGGVVHLTLPVTTPWLAVRQHGARLAARLNPEEANHAIFKRKAPEKPSLRKSGLAKRIRGLLEYQYLMVRALEPGVAAGVDPEFLHQYRVNLRRSRAIGESVLATAQEPVSKKMPGFKKRLKRLKRRAQATSDLRDLDVFLESLDETSLPLSPPSCQALQRWLQARHREQQEALCQQLSDPDYAEEMQDWHGVITSKGFSKALGKLSSKRIEAVLAERIEVHDNELASLSADSPDEVFHDLRKSVKRIRYLAELEPINSRNKRHRDFLARLKRRQTLLGNFQDLCVRQIWIKAFDRHAGGLSELEQEWDAWGAELEKQKLILREEIMALAPLAT